MCAKLLNTRVILLEDPKRALEMSVENITPLY